MPELTPCIEHGRGSWYTYIHVDGKRVRQHRHVLELKSGRKLLPGEVARHTCDNKACINPEHIIVGTHGDNLQDSYDRGGRAVGSAIPHAKLDEAAVLAARAEYIPRHRTHGMRAIARRLGVCQLVLWKAIHGITWKGAGL